MTPIIMTRLPLAGMEQTINNFLSYILSLGHILSDSAASGRGDRRAYHAESDINRGGGSAAASIAARADTGSVRRLTLRASRESSVKLRRKLRLSDSSFRRGSARRSPADRVQTSATPACIGAAFRGSCPLRVKEIL
jgi:hypothetical protein